MKSENLADRSGVSFEPSGIEDIAIGSVARQDWYSTDALNKLKSRDIPFQDTSVSIWDSKYHLKTQKLKPIDMTMDGTYRRVAKALAAIEPKDNDLWEDKFYLALTRGGCIPAGRITSNIGALEQKPGTSTINCTVSGVVHDSMEGILSAVYEAGLTLKAGCGIGYEFSTLRPRGAMVAGVGATTNGPLAFMDIYDKMCMTISSAGNRRGAQMATFDVSHPDVEDFITAKREDGRLRQFNLSLLITEDFIDAVQTDGDWKLTFPLTTAEQKAHIESDSDEAMEVVERHMPWFGKADSKKYVMASPDVFVCKVYRTIKARALWDKIMKSTYDFAEPGFILIDRVNRMNNNWWCEDIRATNP